MIIYSENITEDYTTLLTNERQYEVTKIYSNGKFVHVINDLGQTVGIFVESSKYLGGKAWDVKWEEDDGELG